MSQLSVPDKTSSETGHLHEDYAGRLRVCVCLSVYLRVCLCL